MKYIEELQKFIEVMSAKYDIPEYFKEQFLDFKQEDKGQKMKKVGIIGDSFYSIYVRAYGLKPVFLSGGSYYSGENAEMFPQISDPIAKSSIGLLLDKELNLLEELDAVLVVALNDSYKKSIAYLKEMGIKVIQVEPIPYIRQGLPFSLLRQQCLVLNDISKLVFGIFNESVFKKELKAYEKAYEIINEDNFKALPTMVQSFLIYVLHTMYDKNDWCLEMEEYLEDKTDEIQPSKVTVMGSCMHMPNYKVFQIFNDIGIEYFDNECIDLPNFYDMDISGGAVSLLKACFKFQHINAFKAETVSNVNTVKLPNNTGGIIYYLLKGQISEAYKAERMEELAIKQGVPFICVETDYTYTDLEQMKIRIEAFYEMLKAKNKAKVSI